MPQHSPESGVFEYASTSIFWLLAIFILLFWIFTAVIPPGPPLVSISITPTLLPIRFTSRFQPFITNHLRRYAFITIYISILYLQLLEGRWALLTTFRFARVFFEGFPGYEESTIWTYMVYVNSAAIVCCFVVFVVGFGVVVVTTQVLAIAEVVIGKPRDGVLAGEKGALCFAREELDNESKRI